MLLIWPSEPLLDSLFSDGKSSLPPENSELTLESHWSTNLRTRIPRVMSGSDDDSESGSVLMLEASKTGEWHTLNHFTMCGPNGDEKLNLAALAMGSFSLLLTESSSLVSDKRELANSLSLSSMMIMDEVRLVGSLHLPSVAGKKTDSQVPRCMVIGWWGLTRAAASKKSRNTAEHRQFSRSLGFVFRFYLSAWVELKFPEAKGFKREFGRLKTQVSLKEKVIPKSVYFLSSPIKSLYWVELLTEVSASKVHSIARN